MNETRELTRSHRMHLPSERFLVCQPQSLYLQHLFYNVATATIATVRIRYVARNGFYFRHCIFRATGKSAHTHHFQVGDVIAYIQYFLILQSMTVADRSSRES